MRTRALLVLAALAAVIAPLLIWLAAGGEGDGREVGDQPVVVEVTVTVDRQPEPRSFSLVEGQRVILRVASDSPDELHLHGYDLSVEVEPGQYATLEFVADRTGRFEFELEEREVTLGALEVRPR